MKLIWKCNDYLLNYFGWNWTQFWKLGKFLKPLHRVKYFWYLFDIAIFVYCVTMFLIHEIKLYFYIKPIYFVNHWKHKFLKYKNRNNGYQGYESYAEYNAERQIDWGRDMYG